MARSSTAPTTKSKSKKATTNSARDGYAKRHAKKAKPSADDVYEYSTDSRKLSRRAKVGLELDHDEELGGDVPDDEEERNRLRARLIGENEDNEMIDSEDDEDLDSDAAFDESDDDRFAGFFSSKPVKVRSSWLPGNALQLMLPARVKQRQRQRRRQMPVSRMSI